MLNIKPYNTVTLPDAFFHDIEKVISKKYPEFDNQIGIYFSDTEQSYRLSISYKDINLPRKNSYTTSDVSSRDELLEGFEDIVKVHLKKITCQHNYNRPQDAFGAVITDGRAICDLCGFEHPSALPKGEGKLISMSSTDDLMAKFEWPDKCYVQGGESGIVLPSKSGSKPYTTAFCEAFPDIDGIGTFIRGEGKTIREAEEQCHKKFMARSACKKHEWTRTVNEQERTDGYARCTHCNLTGTVLPPTTLCIVCEKPTTKTIGDKYYCATHRFEQDYDVLFNDHVETHENSIFKSSIKNDGKMRFEFFIQHTINVFWFKELGEELFDKYSSPIFQTYVHFKEWLLMTHFEKKGLSLRGEYPEANHPEILRSINYYKANKDKVMSFILGKGKLSLKDIIAV